MNLLTTGGTGLIGSEISHGAKISSRNYDLRSWDQALRMVHDHRPDAIIHAAGLVGGVAANTERVYDFYLENNQINTNVIESARQAGVPKLLAFASTCVFPDQVQYPLRESDIHLGPPHDSNYGYAYAKRMVEVQIRACNQQYGTNYFTVVPTNVYGPRDNYDLDHGHVLPSLIHRCWIAREHGLDFEVWGSGQPRREFVFSRDVAKICEILIAKHSETDPVIISNGQEVSIREVVDLITAILEFRGRVIWNSDRPDGQHRKPTDISRLKSIIGEFEFTDLRRGLEFAIEYFVNNLEGVRK